MSKPPRLDTFLTWLRGRSRFNCRDQESPAWDERANAAVMLCRRHLRPSDAPGRALVVADLGCGNRRLERALEDGLGRRCQYRGYDLHPQSRRTTRIDLQRELPPGPVDLAVAVGVLEYLDDVPAFLARLSRFAALAVVSYVILDSPEPLSPQEREDRGWRSHYSGETIEALLVAAGYRVEGRLSVNRERTVLWMARRPAP